ncbi:hypothetical protein ATANTOWER_005979 [Ataeniobius toweri]|uniref:Uncharacterized protein n=1 Tax=Ataeniobius toweri TaxID=208326 RepID=A0ABU7BGZ9_9TELE|nr:hypothetical protein [Ataeniobius toweri]
MRYEETIQTMQKDPRQEFEPRTFLLQGNSGNKCSTMQTPLCWSFICAHRLSSIWDQVTRAAVSAENPRLPSPQTPPPALLEGAHGIPRPVGRHRRVLKHLPREASRGHSK